MQTVDLRLDPRWVVPVVPRGALAAHSVIIDAGRIVAVVPVAEADRDYDATEHLRLATHALMPGLVNAHTHAAMSLLRGSADDVALAPWLQDHIWPLEKAFLSPEFVHDGTLLAAAEMLAGGVTCCNDQYFFPDAAARAYQASGMRAMLGLAVLDFPTAYAVNADGYLQSGLAARDKWKHEPLLSFSLAPQAPPDAIDHDPFARPAAIADGTRRPHGDCPVDYQAADANAGTLERADAIVGFGNRHFLRQRHPVECHAPRIAQQRRGLARLLREQIDQTVGRLGAADARELIANEAVFFVQRVQSVRQRRDRLRGGQQAQGVARRRGVDDDFVVIAVLREADDFAQADELVDSRDRQPEKRVDVLSIEPGPLLDDLSERLLMRAQPSGECAACVDLGRVQGSRCTRAAGEADGVGTR